MNEIEIVETIEKYNLATRRIPDKIISCYEIQHVQPCDEIIMHGGRQFARRTKIPKHAGMYMCKSVNSTCSTVSWDIRFDNLAPSLEESLTLFLQNIKEPN